MDGLKQFGPNIYAQYRHFKGGIYTLLAIALNTETKESEVVYSDCEGQVWVRPANMFFEDVQLPDGTIVPRFSKLTKEIKK